MYRREVSTGDPARYNTAIYKQTSPEEDSSPVSTISGKGLAPLGDLSSARFSVVRRRRPFGPELSPPSRRPLPGNAGMAGS